MTDEQYFNHYGLYQEPFAEVKDDKEFYTSPELEHRIELIKHLIEFSDRILVINGEAGSGKTSLLNHLLSNSDEKWNLCRLPFNDINTIEDFFKYIYKDQGLEYRELDSYGSKIVNLQDYFEDLQSKGYIPVLFIDDAHYLSIEILKLLFELAITEQKKPALHVVLFSETNIAELVNHKNLGFIHALDMPLYTEEQVAEYLAHRLMFSGYQGDNMIDLKLVKSIHKTSNGLPGLINELATKALQDPALNKQDKNYIEQIKLYLLNPKYTLPLALILLSCFIIYTLQNTETDPDVEVQSTEVEIPKPENVEKNESNEIIKPAPEVVEAPEQNEQEQKLDQPRIDTSANIEKDEPEIVLLNTKGEIIYESEKQTTQLEEQAESTGLVEDLPKKVEDTIKTNSIDKTTETETTIENIQQTVEQQQDSKIIEPEDNLIKDTISKPELIQKIEPVETIGQVEEKPVQLPIEEVPETEITKPEAIPAEAKQAEIEPSTGFLRGKQWLMQQSPNHYVLQIMGVHDGDAMDKFIEKNIRYRQNLAKFTTVNQNKSWYVLVYGNYPDREKAVAAIPKLPQILRDLKPWPRKIETIQQDLQ